MNERDGIYRGGHSLKPIPEIFNHSLVNGSFNTLTRLERDVLLMRFTEPRHSLTETAHELVKSDSYISYIESQALKSLREMIGEYPGRNEELIGDSPDTKKERLEFLYKQGESLWDISFQIGVSSSTVRSWFKKLGIMTRSRLESLIQSMPDA